MCDFNNIQFMQYLINARYFNQKRKEMNTVYIEGTDMVQWFLNNHTSYNKMFKKSLAKMFTAVLIHGYQPKTFLLATIASIPNDSIGNICSGSNYRGITIYSSIAKLMDIIMIIRYKDKLQTSDM